ncbi:aldo-keto reductase [Grosmannia clavigera kw1407]|uniref:Aldo-keto reductase n=1 Tax=Grosmannia clavigera (strain kw1407 / UAMH 11150) TaxID=655863 RepID=F0XTP7_GROCL|nr:aldo-keto reductase [Grosmannia clavigera kw1407]EFW98815.1 aldo-keto reductase [Grosmannia clavigera kw1407]
MAPQQAPIRTAAGTHLPRLVYGTAWKKDATADLVYAAVRAGFRAIDTAAQPRHYREDLVAAGLQRALDDGLVARRADLYVQTKFTSLAGQDVDGPLPYDPAAPLAEQVRQSVESSLRHFRLAGRSAVAPGEQPDEQPYLDCVLLHSPFRSREATREAWRALLAFVPARVRSLGISNTSLADLKALIEVAREVAREEGRNESAPIVPVVVQNRLHRGQADHDVALRRFCGSSGSSGSPIVYQSFWTLTANKELLYQHPDACGIAAVATGAEVSPEIALYALVTLGLGGSSAGRPDGPDAPHALCPVVVLDGTTSPDHMAADLAGLARVEAWATQGGSDAAAAWLNAVADFRWAIDEK